MTKRWRVVTPTIVVDDGGRFGLKFTLVLVILGIFLAFFLGGYYVGRWELSALEDDIRISRQENATLRNQLNAQLQQYLELDKEHAALKRIQQIDHEALQMAREEHKKLQQINLELEKDIANLSRVVRKGGGSYLRIREFTLTKGDAGDSYHYGFTVSQMEGTLTESSGDIIIHVSGVLEGKKVSLGLEDLPGSAPTEQKMRLRHFQNISGKLKLPQSMVPESMEIEIMPSSKNSMPLKESFNWRLDG